MIQRESTYYIKDIYFFKLKETAVDSQNGSLSISNCCFESCSTTKRYENIYDTAPCAITFYGNNFSAKQIFIFNSNSSVISTNVAENLITKLNEINESSFTGCKGDSSLIDLYRGKTIGNSLNNTKSTSPTIHCGYWPQYYLVQFVNQIQISNISIVFSQSISKNCECMS